MPQVTERYWSKLQTSVAYKEGDLLADLEAPAAPLISGYGSSRSAGSRASLTQLVPGDGRPRRLSPRECARLQGFPEAYRLPSEPMAWYRAIGNAVPVPMAAAVAAQLLDALQGGHRPLCGARAALRCAARACKEPEDFGKMKAVKHDTMQNSSSIIIKYQGYQANVHDYFMIITIIYLKSIGNAAVLVVKVEIGLSRGICSRSRDGQVQIAGKGISVRHFLEAWQV